ncbi:MAG: Delta-9 acyl-phospholipid desaturase [Proteobacteria bacterium]|jgi:stearoyl-CoA desaturase (Delta-9 desaturase)|nr:Delta-9 acyl-phospholipid desaturase [Pseudomonadota bacterium]
MIADNIQRTEGPRTVIVRALIGHAALLGVFFVPVTKELLIAALIGFFIRVFSIEGGVHRYFSHRSYKTSRTFQCILAALAAANGQRGPIWWAVIHRRHHRFSDQPGDPHSPVTLPWYKAYYTWLIDEDTLATPLDEAKDLSRYPELVWINKHHYVFPLATLAATYLVGEYTTLFGATGLGLAAVVWVFFVSMVASQHAPYMVNVFAHGTRPGPFNLRRFQTGDTSTNMWWWTLPSMGAAFHNNHHRYMNAARAGFYWYEPDPTYWVLRMLALLGIVWDLKEVPAEVLEEGRRGITDLRGSIKAE